VSQPVKWILGILSTVGFVLALLSWGNPQWGKWTYMWQAYVIRDEDTGSGFELRWTMVNIINIDHGPIELPKQYTGNWKHWDEQGDLISITTFEDGIEIGFQYGYESDGDLETLNFWDAKRNEVTIYSNTFGITNNFEMHKSKLTPEQYQEAKDLIDEAMKTKSP